MAYKYSLRYKLIFESGSFSIDEIEKDEAFGACDAGLFISIITPPDGGYSQQMFGINGKTNKDLTQNEIFKAWMMMGMTLADNIDVPGNEPLNGWKKELVQIFADNARLILHKMK